MREEYDHFNFKFDTITVRTRINDDGSLNEQLIMLGNKGLSPEEVADRWSPKLLAEIKGKLATIVSKYVTKKEEVSVED